MSRRQRRTQTRLEQQPDLYQPLPPGGYIRVLQLYPGDHNDVIRCGLKIMSHKKSANKYSAISYVWGDPHDTVDILCNGQIVHITVNLADALRHFRHPRTLRRLWADALCINQNDYLEKNYQVSHMGTVYRNANTVLVWLGLDSENIAQNTFTMVERMTSSLDEQFKKADADGSMLPLLQSPDIVPMDSASWLAVNKLASLPWFDRVWTIQECALANSCHIYWGSAQLDMADLVEFSRWCTSIIDLNSLVIRLRMTRILVPNFLFTRFHSHYREGHTWQSTRPLLASFMEQNPQLPLSLLLRDTAVLNTSDVRDYIYAFVGFSGARVGQGRSIVDVDYSKSLAEIAHDAACILLRLPAEGPWVLHCIGYNGRSELMTPAKVPTWVPRWGSCAMTPSFVETIGDFAAGGSIEYFSPHFEGYWILRLQGFVFDSIAWRSSEILPYDLSTSPEVWSEEVRAANEPVIDSIWRRLQEAASYLDIEADYTAFASAVLGSATPHAVYCVNTYLELARSAMSGFPSCLRQMDVGCKGYANMAKVCNAIVATLSERCLFLTRSGRIGVASAASDVEDLCCIFLGAMVPFLLAPTDEGRCRLVGESYIHGVMMGELLDQYEPYSITLV